MIKILLTTTSILFLCSGCATLVSQSEYSVKIMSCPSEAEFVIQKQDGEHVARGITPKSVTLDSGEGYFNPANYIIYFRKKGYQEESISLDGSLDGWYFGSILPIPLLIFVVDPLSGAMWKLPYYTMVSLKPDAVSTAKIPLKLATIEDAGLLTQTCTN